MPLSPGTTLGPYSVTAPLGAGGMGLLGWAQYRHGALPKKSPVRGTLVYKGSINATRCLGWEERRTLIRPGVRVVACLVLAMALAGCSRRPLVLPDANLLLIVIDTLRADHLGIYGYGRDTSPTLDRLAREGVWFERVVTQGAWTRPAVGSLCTSLYPTAHGAAGHGRTLSAEALTLAEAMRAEGYVTLGVQTNPFLRGARTFAQGFDSYEKMIGASGPRVIRRFKQELERLDPQKFFAYVHLMDVHLPYNATESFRRMFEKGYDGSIFGADEIRLRDRTVAQTKRLTETDKRHVIDLYDAGVREADSYVAEILEELEARG